MFKHKDGSYYEEGNGYRVNNIPSDVNYNTCSIGYALNHDFEKNTKVHYTGSTNTHTRRSHTDVNASTNEQRPSGAYCSRPMGTQRTINAQKPYTKKASPAKSFILPIIIFLIFIIAITRGEAIPIIAIIAVIVANFSSKNKTNRRR